MTPTDEPILKLVLKNDGEYAEAPVGFDLDRGKVWIYVADEVICVEAPRLRALVAAYDAQLAESGLAQATDGYLR